MWKDSYNPKYDIDNWMYTIILNSFRDFRRNSLSSLEFDINIIENDEVYRVTQLGNLIDYIPDYLKEVGELYLKGYRAKEIYRMTNMTYGSVRVYCHKIRQILKKVIT